MKPVLILASIIALAALDSSSVAQRACGLATVLATVEVPQGEFSMADLLAPSACPAMRRAAAQVRVGSAPLPGSVRVMRADEVRSLFQKVAPSNQTTAWNLISMPERITVRRAGGRASCAEIGAQILAALPPHLSTDQTFFPGAMDCGAAGRVPKDSPLELARMAWNPAQTSWEISARCVRPADCVPFLVRLRGQGPLAETEGSIPGSASTIAQRKLLGKAWVRPLHGPAPGREHVRPLVRAGETATLSWDEAGIRLIVTVVCLEPGGMGERVRVRSLHGGRVVRAVVVSAGQLRVAA